MDHQSSREVVKTCEWKKRLLEKSYDETAACIACLGNLPIHVERALELCGAPSLGESREGIESNEARIGMRNVIEPGEQRFAAKNAEFPIIDWLVIQPLFLNDGLIHPDTVPLFSFGGPLRRMHPVERSETRKQRLSGQSRAARGSAGRLWRRRPRRPRDGTFAEFGRRG